MTVQQNETVQPYIFFDGKCEEALDFYKSAIGAKVDMMMRFKESARSRATCRRIRARRSCMRPSGSARPRSWPPTATAPASPSFQGFGLALNAKNDAEAEKLFTAVGKGGQVQQPLTKTFFASKFGMVTDKFGIMWMVIAEAK